jgi:tetratricopeptide (TPR) repeat protein
MPNPTDFPQNPHSHAQAQDHKTSPHPQTQKTETSTLHELALKYQKNKLYDKASTIWRGILARKPDDITAANNLSILLRHLGRLAESEAVLRKALKTAPHIWTLWFALGQTLDAWQNDEAALDAFITALEIAPQEASTHYTIATLLLKMNVPIDALFHFRETIRLAPKHAPAHTGAARTLSIIEETSEAESLLTQAISLDPFDPSAHYWLAHHFLSSENTKRGWMEYEWRFKAGLHLQSPTLPVWQGEPLRSRILLIDTEPRTAETLFFLRFLRFLPKHQIILRCPQNLIPLARSSGFAEYLWPKNQESPPHDTPTPHCWCPLGSLPLLTDQYRNPRSLDTPYIKADVTEVPSWKRLFAHKPTIGIAWRGGFPFLDNRIRGFPLEDLEPLLSIPSLSFVSLQRDLSHDEKEWLALRNVFIPDPSFDESGGFINSAALINALTLVISPGTALAHLTGALGKPAWIVANPGHEWLWQHQKGDAYWYPSIEIFPTPYDQSSRDTLLTIKDRLLSMQTPS